MNCSSQVKVVSSPVDCHEERDGARLGPRRVLRRHGGGADPGPRTQHRHPGPPHQGPVLHPRGQRHQHLHERGERAGALQARAHGRRAHLLRLHTASEALHAKSGM